MKGIILSLLIGTMALTSCAVRSGKVDVELQEYDKGLYTTSPQQQQ